MKQELHNLPFGFMYRKYLSQFPGEALKSAGIRRELSFKNGEFNKNMLSIHALNYLCMASSSLLVKSMKSE